MNKEKSDNSTVGMKWWKINKINCKSIDKIKAEWYYIINPKEIQNKQKEFLTRKGILKIEYHIFYKMYFYYKFSIRLRIENTGYRYEISGKASDIKYRKVYCREREWMNNDYRMVSRGYGS